VIDEIDGNWWKFSHHFHSCRITTVGIGEDPFTFMLVFKFRKFLDNLGEIKGKIHFLVNRESSWFGYQAPEIERESSWRRGQSLFIVEFIAKGTEENHFVHIFNLIHLVMIFSIRWIKSHDSRDAAPFRSNSPIQSDRLLMHIVTWIYRSGGIIEKEE